MGAKYEIPVGELIDRLSIINNKIWHCDEKQHELGAKAKLEDDLKESEHLYALSGRMAQQARELNNERSAVREEINYRLEGYKRGSDKINYPKADNLVLGRDTKE